jgi:hypothetical protein
MWATLAFALAVSTVPAQGGTLTLTNPRATYGFLGGPRPDNAVLPGDVYFIAFDIENLTMKDDEVTYRMGVDLINEKGKVLYGEEPQEKKAHNSLGGKSLSAFAATEVGTNTPPGEYTVKVTVVDPLVKGAAGTKTLESKFKVLPTGFGVVRVNTLYIGQTSGAAPSVLVSGQSILVSCIVVGFERAKTGDKQPNIALQWRIIDDSTGKPTLDKPIDDQVPGKDRKVPEDLTAIPISLPLDLNRPGKFTIELQLTDRLNTTAKPVTVKLPIRVYDNK